MLGRKVAIDASMWIYQFLAAIREGHQWMNLTNSSGESTSHINGMLSRTTRLLESGIKPVFVFDGTPPDIKREELAKRDERREKAIAELEKAQELGDEELIKKQSIRTIHVTKKQIDDVKKLLGFLGMPCIDAPSEAEAQCAELCKDDLVYGVVTEDADSLTFGTPIQIKQLNFSESMSNKVNGKSPAKQKNGMQIIKLPLILSELDITMDQFIDLCILSGCDYCGTIRGIGTCTAYKLIKKHQNIEGILQNIDQAKNPVPENFEYAKVREFFKNPIVSKKDQIQDLIKWSNPKYEELSEWLIKEQNFNETRVASYCERIKKSKGKTSQTSLDGFFKQVPNEKAHFETPSRTPQTDKPNKRPKAETEANPPLRNDRKKVKPTESETVSEWGVPKHKSLSSRTERDRPDKVEAKNESEKPQCNAYEDKEAESSTVESTLSLKTESSDSLARPVKRKLNRLISESDED